MKSTKILSLILAVVLVLSFSGCAAIGAAAGNALGENMNGDNPIFNSSESSEPSEEYNNGNSTYFDRGYISGSSYYNDTVGVSFTVPSDWTFYTDEELANFYGMALGEIEFPFYGNSIIPGCFASNSVTGDAIEIAFEHFSSYKTDYEYAESKAEEIKNGFYSNSGITEVETMIDGIVLQNAAFSAIAFDIALDSGSESYKQITLIRNFEEYKMIICVSGYNYEYIMEILENYFYFDFPNEENSPFDLERGEIEGNGYSNFFMGLNIYLPTGYHFVSDEQFAADSGVTVERLREISDDATYCVKFMNDSTGSNTSVQFAKIPEGQNFQDVIAALDSDMIPVLESQGLTVVDKAWGATYLTDKLVTAFVYAINIDGYSGDIYSVQILDEVGDYYSIITLTGFTEEDIDAMEASLTILD